MMGAVEGVDHRDYTFLDLGCGKGRTVLLASACPFKRVIGIDFSPALLELAKRNLARYYGTIQAPTAELFLADAAEFPVPPGNLLVYLFDPFGDRVLQKVLGNLVSAAKQRRQRVLLLYYSDWRNCGDRGRYARLWTRSRGRRSATPSETSPSPTKAH
jgi:SAM-dependent methyltransferase